jgi:hypothetical protein
MPAVGGLGSGTRIPGRLGQRRGGDPHSEPITAPTAASTKPRTPSPHLAKRNGHNRPSSTVPLQKQRSLVRPALGGSHSPRRLRRDRGDRDQVSDSCNSEMVDNVIRSAIFLAGVFGASWRSASMAARRHRASGSVLRCHIPAQAGNRPMRWMSSVESRGSREAPRAEGVEPPVLVPGVQGAVRE